MADAPRKIPVVFYRTPAGAEVVLDWLRELDVEDRRVVGQDPHARPVPMANRHAVVPAARRWFVGASLQPARQSGRKAVLLFRGRADRCAAWLHKEVPEDAACGVGNRSQEEE